MASDEPRIALRADPNDPEDFDVTEEALKQALAERRERLRALGIVHQPMEPEPEDEPVMLRLDRAVLDRFRAGGPGWEQRINAALRSAAGL